MRWCREPPPIDIDRWSEAAPPAPPAPSLRRVVSVVTPAPPAVAIQPVRDVGPAAPMNLSATLSRPLRLQPSVPSVRPPRPVVAVAAVPAVAAVGAASAAAPPDTRESEGAAPPTQPVPLYATRLPAPTELHYVAQRGTAIGTARLQWRVDGDGYELTLDAEVPGQPLLGSSSRGRLDVDGMAPSRHVERRKLREVRAVNFQREAGLISFSGPSEVVPLSAGAQDRLSWMIQLPAIVQANPALAAAGETVTLFVVGTRGDAQAWRFEARGRESIELPDGPAAELPHFVRQPVRPFDTRVEVWLDPQREHLPVRARLTTVPGGPSLELRLAPTAAVATGLN